MAILTNEHVNKILESSRNRELEDADKHEGRLQLHSQSTIYRPGVNEARGTKLGTAWADFLTIPEALLPVDKRNTFRDLITFPLPTVEVTERAYEELYKVFQSENKVIDYMFEDEEMKTDFEEYLDEIGEPEFWSTKGWEVYKNYINSMIIVDLPRIEMDADGNVIGEVPERPEPYFYVLHTEKIHDVKNDHHGNCEWVVFYTGCPKEIAERYDVDRLYVTIDDEAYRHYVYAGDQAVLIHEAFHDLGYPPARMFWTTPLRNSKIQRQNQATPNLGGLDWFLYSDVTARHLDLYAGYPVITVFEQECTYRSNGWYCEEGYLFREDEDLSNTNGLISNREPCPNCNTGRSLVGPGTVLEIPNLNVNDEAQKQMPALDITKGDIDSLEYMQEKLSKMEKRIMINMIGFGGDPKNDAAKNEKQIMGSFESRTVILRKIARNFEYIQKFTVDTIAKLRYGPENYVGSQIWWGNQFFLQSVEEMQEDYQTARNNGMPNYHLAEQRKKIIKREFINDPAMRERMLMMSILEPYESYTKEELFKMSAGLDARLLSLKVNFNDLMQRFELENGAIQNYLPQLPFEARIRAIQVQLQEWVDEIISAATPETPPTPPPPGTPPVPPAEDDDDSGGAGSGDDDDDAE